MIIIELTFNSILIVIDPNQSRWKWINQFILCKVKYQSIKIKRIWSRSYQFDISSIIDQDKSKWSLNFRYVKTLTCFFFLVPLLLILSLWFLSRWIIDRPPPTGGLFHLSFFFFKDIFLFYASMSYPFYTFSLICIDIRLSKTVKNTRKCGSWRRSDKIKGTRRTHWWSEESIGFRDATLIFLFPSQIIQITQWREITKIPF